MKIKHILLVSLCAVCVDTACAQVNLIKNGDFESATPEGLPTSWQSFPHESELKSIRVERGGIGQSQTLTMGIAATPTQCGVSQKLAVKKDSTYLFEGYASYSGKVTQEATISVESTSGETLFSQSIRKSAINNNSVTDAKDFFHTFEYRSSTDTLVIHIQTNGINRLLRVDNLSFSLKATEVKPDVPETQAAYYVDPEAGANTNDGLTAAHPLKDLSGVPLNAIQPGCRILFKAGTEYKGNLTFTNVHGNADAPILISSYSTDDTSESSLATLNAAGQLSAITLDNCSHFDISHLEIHADGGGFTDEIQQAKMRCGILVRTTEDKSATRHIRLSDLDIHDIFYYNPGYHRPNDQSSANGTGGYGYGIRFLNTPSQSVMDDIQVSDVQIQRVSHTGIRLTGATGSGSMISHVNIGHVDVSHSGGPGMQMGSVTNGHVHHCSVDQSGSASDTRNWQRGSGLWTWGCDSVIVEHNSFTNASGPADSFGSHIDYNCKNIIFQYNFYANNVGGFVEILGNSWNCSYRYNVSVNDGTRTQGQPGRAIWISGYCGRGSKRQGPNNIYIYNNTIISPADVVSRYSIEKTTKGILLANNIFHVEGSMKSASKSGHSKPAGKDVFFENNLLLKDEFPQLELGGGKNAIIGDALFANPSGSELIDFTPTNKALVYGRGVQIEKLPGDQNGLMTGLQVDTDILGTPLNGRIDLGAIACGESSTGIGTPETDDAEISIDGSTVSISTTTASHIQVYNMQGHLVHQSASTQHTSFEAAANIYLIKINNHVHKIIVY